MATATTALGYEDLPELLTLLTGDEKHDWSSLSTLDVLWVLYDRVLREGDRFLLSKGHGPAAYYAVLAARGLIPQEELSRFGRFDSTLGYHPDRVVLPAAEISSGSLGHGLPIAVGVALAGRRTYVLVGDGELDEGSTWEAAMGAHHHQLGNLTAMVDINALQADGKTDTVLRTEPITEKWEAAGWYAQRVDGNDVAALLAAFDKATAQAATTGRPSVILCDTKVGRGVPLLEEREKAHFMRIEEHEWQTCREQLTAGYEGKASA